MQLAYEVVEMIMKRSLKLSAELDHLDEQLNLAKDACIELEMAN